MEQQKFFVFDFMIESCYPSKMMCHALYFRSWSWIFIEISIFYHFWFLALQLRKSIPQRRYNIIGSGYAYSIVFFLLFFLIYFTLPCTLHFLRKSAKFKMLPNKNIFFWHFRAIKKIIKYMRTKILFYLLMQNSIASKTNPSAIDFELACVNGGQKTKINYANPMQHCVKIPFGGL